MRCWQLIKGSVLGPWSCHSLAPEMSTIPCTLDRSHAHLLKVPGRTSCKICLSSQKPQDTGWAGNTIYLAACSRGRIRALLSFRQEGEAGVRLGRVGRFSKGNSKGLGMEADRWSLKTTHSPHPWLTHPSS